MLTHCLHTQNKHQKNLTFATLSKNSEILTTNYLIDMKKLVALCPARGKPGDGDRSFNEDKINGGYPVETGLTYWCNLHYRVKGERQQECREDGTWSHNPVSCKRNVLYIIHILLNVINVKLGKNLTLSCKKSGKNYIYLHWDLSSLALDSYLLYK